MFAMDKRKFEVRDRIARNKWDEFDLDDLGLITLIYEMDVGESLNMVDDKDRHFHVMKNEGGLTVVHADFEIYNAHLEIVGMRAFFQNDNVHIDFSLKTSKVLMFFVDGEN